MKREAFNHSKVLKLCRLLAIEPAHGRGIVHSLWHLAATEAPAGDIGKLDDVDIALQIGTEIDPERLVDALTSVRLLDRHPDHRLLVHDWPEHCEDGVHRKLARRGLHFADGSLPSLSRLSPREREAAEKLYAVRPEGAMTAPEVRTTGAHRAPSSPSTSDLPAYLAALQRLHPKFKDEFAVSNALAEVRSLLPPLPEFEAVLAAWSKTEDWTKDGSRFAPAPARWLRDGGFRTPPPTVKRAPAKPARTVDDVRREDAKPALLAALQENRITRDQHDALLDRAAMATTLSQLTAILREIPDAAA